MSSGKELYVTKIKDGTVIDHISPGFALNVIRILNITGKEGYVVSAVVNVPSGKLGKKDIVKIESRELIPEEVDKIALISPKATINIIRNYEVVDKKKVKLPKVIKGIVRCINPSCISNAKEPIESFFLVEIVDPLRIRCHYCGGIMEMSDVLKQF